MIKKRSWYKPFSTVLFCPPSPGSILVKELRKVAEEETRGKGWTVKVVERAGVKLAHQVPGLKEPTVCKKGDFFIHISGFFTPFGNLYFLLTDWSFQKP